MVDWKNVNNWHWNEKDYFSKTKDFFNGQIGKTIGQKTIIRNITDLDGIVTVNVRKGKIIPVFDFKAHILLNEDDTDLNLFLEFDSSTKSFLDIDLRGAHLSNESRTDLEQISSEFNQFLIETALKDFSLEKSQSHLDSKASNNDLKISSLPISDTSSRFSEKWKFYCPADLLIHAISNPPFPIKDGYFNIHNLINFKVSGLVGGSIKLKWKLKDWNEFSDVAINMKPGPSGTTSIELDQLNVSSDFVYSASENWESHFWEPLSTVYGFSFEREKNI